MIGSRTRSREIALQVLFSLDLRPGEPHLRFDPTTLEDAEASTEVKEFASELVQGVLADLARIDELIQGAADNWDMGRLATVDRNVLRLAVHEILSRDDIPPKVSINEAIELGKRFSGAQSGLRRSLPLRRPRIPRHWYPPAPHRAQPRHRRSLRTRQV